MAPASPRVASPSASPLRSKRHNAKFRSSRRGSSKNALCRLLKAAIDQSATGPIAYRIGGTRYRPSKYNLFRAGKKDPRGFGGAAAGALAGTREGMNNRGIYVCGRTGIIAGISLRGGHGNFSRPEFSSSFAPAAAARHSRVRIRSLLLRRSRFNRPITPGLIHSIRPRFSFGDGPFPNSPTAESMAAGCWNDAARYRVQRSLSLLSPLPVVSCFTFGNF